MDITDRKWEVVYTTTFAHEAHLVKSYLEGHGLSVLLSDEYLIQNYSFYSNALGGVKIKVLQEHIIPATELLIHAGYPIEDQKEVYIVSKKELKDLNSCPFCEEKSLCNIKEENLYLRVISSVFGMFFPLLKTGYECTKCLKRWKLN